MSDMEVREISAPKSENSSTKEVKGSPFKEAAAQEVGRGDWFRSRMCACSYNALTDCRFHSPSEPGWEHCPNIPAGTVELPANGRWLWSKQGGASNFDDSNSDPIEEAANKLTAELLQSVKSSVR